MFTGTKTTAAPVKETAIAVESSSDHEQELTLVYDEYARGLFRYSRVLLGSAEDAEDAVQEVFVRLARDISRVRQIRDLKSYLLKSTRNACFEVLRGRQRRERLQESAAKDLCYSAEITPGCESEVVLDAFKDLPEMYREVIALKVFNGLTFEEIGKVIGKSKNTVSSRYRYAIERIKTAIGSDEDET